MSKKSISKTLATMEDLAQGIGKVTQVRAGKQHSLGKIDVPYSVTNEAALKDLNVNLFTKAKLDNLTYEYDPLDNSGITPNVGSGSWIKTPGTKADDVMLDSGSTVEDWSKLVETLLYTNQGPWSDIAGEQVTESMRRYSWTFGEHNYGVFPSVALPVTAPADPTTQPDVWGVVTSGVNLGTVKDQTTIAQGELVNGEVFPSRDYAVAGDNVPVGVTHLRTANGILVAYSPDFSTQAHSIVSVSSVQNDLAGYDVVTDKGTFEFVTQKNYDYREEGDVRGWGALDDYNGSNGATCKNNKVVFDHLITLRPIVITMKKSRGGTGVFLYGGNPSSPATDLTGLEIIAEPGVSIYSTGTTNSPFWRKGVKYNRELLSEVGGAKYNLHAGPMQYVRPAEHMSKLSAGDGVSTTVDLIDFSSSDVRAYQLSSWPTGTLNKITPVSTSKSDIALGALPATSFKLAGVPVAPGDLIQANVSVGTVRPCVFVETSEGWVIVQQPPQGGTYDFRIQIQYSDGSYIDYDDIMFKQLEYRFERAALGVYIYDSTSFGIVVNGIVVKRVDTSKVGTINLAGWGAGYDTGDLSITRPSLFKNKKTLGIKPLKIVGVGDSTSALTLPPSQYQYMTQYLAGSCGAQVWEMNNIAVGGAGSASQLAALKATDISSYDYCCIQIGINDVQGNIPSLTLLDNINQMIDYCETSGVTPIVGLPIQWYGQADAQKYGQDGQNAQNSFLAPSYRNVVLHGLADRGGVLINQSALEDCGAVLAELLSKPELDPIVQDNIHPSALGQMLMGRSFAKSIIGHLAKSSEVGQRIKAPKYWFRSGLGQRVTPFFNISGDIIEWTYFISVETAITDGEVIATIPGRFRPKSDIVTTAVAMSGNSEIPVADPVCVLQFRTDGRIIANNVPSCAFVAFSVSYHI